MKITITTCQNPDNIMLEWQLPGQKHPMSLYLLESELTPTAWPHVVQDLSRTTIFWGDKLVMFHDVENCTATHGQFPASADVIYCNTFKLLEILRTLKARQVPKATIETDRLPTVKTQTVLTIAQIARHPNLKDPDRLGRTLKYFRDLLKGGDRTFKDLIADVSRFVQIAHVFPQDNEFYFNGRIPGGCGFNGGILPHSYANTYGIHT